jgi:type II secretory pathway component GspD/PulD (secretin)
MAFGWLQRPAGARRRVLFGPVSKPVFRQLKSPIRHGMTCVPDPKSKTLVVTERTSTIREIARLLEQLDVASATKQVEK